AWCLCLEIDWEGLDEIIVGVDEYGGMMIYPLLVSNGISKSDMADEERVRVKSTRKANEDRIEGVNHCFAFMFGGIRVEDRKLQMKFVPEFVSKHSNGTKRISISVEDIKKGSEACALQLYGYFVGTSVDYRVVNVNLSIMWRVYGITDTTKISVGLFYFRFKNNEGMKAFLESGPWMINNFLLILNIWEPGIWLEKVEPSTIPFWPMLMDKLTKERCLKKSGKLDFARVFVEVSVDEELPQFLEIEYHVIGYRPSRIGRLEVKPRIDEEIDAKVLKDVLKVNKFMHSMESEGNDKGDGFTVIAKGVSGNSGYVQKGNTNSKVGNVDSCMVQKPSLNSKYNANSKPKDIVDKEDNFISSVDNEYMNVVWPKLQNEVIEVMKYGLYLSRSFRSNWSLAQLDLFYNNCLKYGMEPYVEDDEVESENECMAAEMRLENVDDVIPDVENGGINEDHGFNESQCLFLELGRRTLWKDLVKHSIAVRGAPWALLGDFIMILDPSERSFGSSAVSVGMEEFRNYVSRIEDKELFLKQKTKVSWLSEGDFNTKYFHNAMKERRNRSRIDFVEDLEGNGFSRDSVGEQFLSMEDAEFMVRPIGVIRNYHRNSGPPRFSKVKFTHLCFVDDLMIFSHGDPGFVAIVKSTLDFIRFSGLKSSLEKSMVSFGNVSASSKSTILSILPFSVGILPIK
ncbi:hypothetical protein Tco_0740051, partial [Tanacetum coccineum]